MNTKEIRAALAAATPGVGANVRHAMDDIRGSAPAWLAALCDEVERLREDRDSMQRVGIEAERELRELRAAVRAIEGDCGCDVEKYAQDIEQQDTDEARKHAAALRAAMEDK